MRPLAIAAACGGARFTPFSMSELQSWLEPAAGTDGASLAELTDLSINARHAPAVSAGVRTNGAIGGRPALTVTGGQRYLAPAITRSTFTVVSLWRARGTNGLREETGANVGVSGGRWAYSEPVNTHYVMRGGVITGRSRTVTQCDDLWRLTTHQYDGTHAGHALRTFGVDELLALGGGSGNPGSLAALGAQTTSLGARGDGTFASTMDLACWMEFSPHLTAAQLAQVEQFVAARFNQTLLRGVTEFVMLGDSTTAAIAGANAASSYLLTNAENPNGLRVASLAVAGNTIQAQLTAWQGSAYRGSANTRAVSILCGLNNLAAQESAATILARYETLIADINTSTPGARVFLWTITPARERWDAVFGVGAASNAVQAVWTAVNAAITAGSLAGTYTVLTSLATALDDGTGALAALYELAAPDHIHENNTARDTLYADAFYTALGAAGLR